MFITHFKANELLGKKVYGKDGQVLGEVVGITSRHGSVKAVILRNEDEVLRLRIRESSAPRPRPAVMA